ncbi:DUF2147 domain-containing protein [Simplicispira psychrophila]|uniref:DUF2147 domain-containing protein n=1 Tax=Simplicispira psychrophila TaxID=80882 RepID=UPI001FE14610|nr:DUF2147 domain-containing protein [Simplicispira psychrophila]
MIFAVAGAPAWAQMTPEGLWRSIDDKSGQPKAEIRIAAQPAGLVGTIERSLQPSHEPLCIQCSDERKNQPKLGMEVIRGAKKAQDKDVWEGGKILDPENGREYSLRLTPIEEGKKLEVRGSFGPFGRTQTWLRVQ